MGTRHLAVMGLGAALTLAPGGGAQEAPRSTLHLPSRLRILVSHPL